MAFRDRDNIEIERTAAIGRSEASIAIG